MIRNASRQYGFWLPLLMMLLMVSLAQPAQAQPIHRMPVSTTLTCELAMHHADAPLCQQCQSGCVWVTAATLLPMEMPQLPLPGSVPPPFRMPAAYPAPCGRPLRPPIS